MAAVKGESADEKDYKQIATKIASILTPVGLESHPFKVKFKICIRNKVIKLKLI